jgi:hypothetical protein
VKESVDVLFWSGGRRVIGAWRGGAAEHRGSDRGIKGVKGREEECAGEGKGWKGRGSQKGGSRSKGVVRRRTLNKEQSF